MATHIAYHNNEMLPSAFAPPIPTSRDHGMLSEYEPKIVMQQSLPPPQIDGGLEITFDDDYPSLIPTTKPAFDLSEWYDPALCLTPEKGSLKKTTTKEKLNRGSDEGLSLRPQHSQKVRFDNFVEVKEMSPKSRTSLEGSAGVVKTDNCGSGSEVIVEKNEQLESVEKKRPVDQDIEIISVQAKDLNKRKPKHNTQSQAQRCATVLEGLLSGTKSTALPSVPESVLARPEFNSTLRVGRELQQIAASELNVTAAVKQKLESSDRIKNSISDKVVSRLNAPDNLYEGLVSLEIREEELIDSVQRERTAKTKPAMAAAKTAKAEDHLVSPPDILDCLTPDLLRETASFSLDGLPPPETGPKTAPLERAFDVFRHIRTWENW